jgi:hypothetical protein
MGEIDHMEVSPAATSCSLPETSFDVSGGVFRVGSFARRSYIHNQQSSVEDGKLSSSSTVLEGQHGFDGPFDRPIAPSNPFL